MAWVLVAAIGCSAADPDPRGALGPDLATDATESQDAATGATAVRPNAGRTTYSSEDAATSLDADVDGAAQADTAPLDEGAQPLDTAAKDEADSDNPELMADAASPSADAAAETANAADGETAADTGLLGADAAGAGDSSSTPVLPPGAPSNTNLIVTVTGLVDGMAGTVSLGLDGGDAGGGKPAADPNAPAVTGPDTLADQTGALPMTLYLHAAPGKWQVLAWVKNASGYTVAGGMLCDGSAAGTVTVSDGAIATVSLQVMTLFGPGGLNKVCLLGANANYSSPLSQVDVVFTPPTKDGAAHFMQGLVQDQRLWVAGSQDGYVSFDFPTDPTLSKPLANWVVHNGQMCNRLVRTGNQMFCSSRNGYLQVAQVNGGDDMVLLDKVWLSSNGMLGSEGMSIIDGHLFIAAHRQGIWRIDTTLQSKVLVVPPPPGCDIWDIRQLDANHLVVGSNLGLHVVDLQLVDGNQSPWGAFVPTPGVAGNLHVDGARVWVGDLSGQVHLFDLSNGMQPQLLGSVAVPSSAYGVWGQGDHGYAAAGHYVVAIDVPASGSGPLLIRGASRSPRFALDVDPIDAKTLMAAEFQDVRRLHIEPSKGQDGPVLLAQPVVYAPMIPLGSKIQSAVRVYNAGQVEAKVTKVEVQEAYGNGVQVKMGPWLVAPGALVTIPFQMSKMKKGVTDHTITLYTDPLTAEPLSLPFIETTWLHPGDALPPLVYSDLKGTSWNVNATIAGKVSVVLIAAHSCPVGFMGMAAAARHLKPWMDSGQLAVVGINPWDTGSAPEVPILELPFPVLHSPLTTKDGHDWSEVLDVTLGQPIPFGPPMPIVYVVGKDGKVALAQWGYSPKIIGAVIEEELAKP